MNLRAIVIIAGLATSLLAPAQVAVPTERREPDAARVGRSEKDTCSTSWSGKQAAARFLGVVDGAHEVVPRGIAGMVGTESGDLYFRTVVPFGLWHVDRSGAMRRLSSVDSVASALGGGFAGPFLQRDGSLLLWHDATGTRIHVSSDDRLRDVRRIAGLANGRGKPVAVSSDGLVFTQRDSVTGQTIVLTGGGGSAVDTVWLGETGRPKKSSCINDGYATVCQIIPFQPEHQWAAGGAGSVVWSDGVDQVLRRSPGPAIASPVACLGAEAAAMISEDERKNAAEIISWANRSNDPRWVGPRPTIPESKPMVDRIVFDQSGRLWVVHPTRSDFIPAAQQRPSFGDSMSPARQWQSRWELLVFADRGVPLARIALPPGVGPDDWAAGGGILWALRLSPSGETMELAKFSIPRLLPT